MEREIIKSNRAATLRSLLIRLVLAIGGALFFVRVDVPLINNSLARVVTALLQIFGVDILREDAWIYHQWGPFHQIAAQCTFCDVVWILIILWWRKAARIQYYIRLLGVCSCLLILNVFRIALTVILSPQLHWAYSHDLFYLVLHWTPIFTTIVWHLERSFQE